MYPDRGRRGGPRRRPGPGGPRPGGGGGGGGQQPAARRAKPPKGPSQFPPVTPRSRKDWKRMYKGTIKRLSRRLGRHATTIAGLSAAELTDLAAAIPRRHDGRRGEAIRLARKLIRLMTQRPTP